MHIMVDCQQHRDFEELEEVCISPYNHVLKVMITNNTVGGHRSWLSRYARTTRHMNSPNFVLSSRQEETIIIILHKYLIKKILCTHLQASVYSALTLTLNIT